MGLFRGLPACVQARLIPAVTGATVSGLVHSRAAVRKRLVVEQDPGQDRKAEPESGTEDKADEQALRRAEAMPGRLSHKCASLRVGPA